jgi:hypothetical protein
MMLQNIFKLLNHNCCQQQAYTEDYQPACTSTSYVEYALPSAGQAAGHAGPGSGALRKSVAVLLPHPTAEAPAHHLLPQHPQRSCDVHHHETHE